MAPEPTTGDPPRILHYSEPEVGHKPFSILALLAGVVTPYAYAYVSLFVIALIEPHRPAVHAFYDFDATAIVALVAFPILVWWIRRKLSSRGFASGVVFGTLAFPVLALVALGVAMSRP